MPCNVRGWRTIQLFFFQAEDGIRDGTVTGAQTCALPILCARSEERRLLGMDELSRQVLKLFIAMGSESLDLHTLFEGGNDPASRQRVLDVVTRLADTG